MQDLFEKAGFYAVRAAGSKGVFDVIAIDRGKVIGIQCKRDGKLLKKERIEMLLVAREYGIIPLLAYMHKRKVTFLDLERNVTFQDIKKYFKN